MKSPSVLKYLLVVFAFTAVCIVAALATPTGTDLETPLRWYSIVPPLLAIVLALLTGRIFLSLGLSILVGGLLYHIWPEPLSIGAWAGGVKTTAGFFYENATDWTNIQILLFVAMIMPMISVVIVAGGLHAIADGLSRYAKGPRSTQVATAFAGLVVFIDDYVNTMIVGSTMRPTSDAQRISREKLAFIVDATSAPVAGIAVISTWIGYEVGLFAEVSESLQLGKDGYSMFFDALAFRFYCFMMIGFVFINALIGADFGPMRKAEDRARATGKVAADDAQPMTSKSFSQLSPDPGASRRARIAAIPIAALFLFFLGGIWIDGGGLGLIKSNPIAMLSLSNWRQVMAASESSTLLLAASAALAMILAVGCAFAFSSVGGRSIGRGLLAGFRSSLLPLCILLCAWSLKSACSKLGTGDFLIATIGDRISPALYPAALFIVAGLTAFATGTSWGTMAILIPMAVPIAYHLDGGTYSLVTMMSLGAVLDGAICGDHCSPISDTTIMSSISTSCDHVHHVRTQIPYSTMVAVLAIVCGYVPAAMGLPSWAGIIASLAVISVLFLVLRKAGRRDSGE